ncbi:sensor domain-containing diguanylate cyclase [Xenophilus aerolatus]
MSAPDLPPLHGEDDRWTQAAGGLLLAFGASAVCCYDTEERVRAWNARYLDFFPEMRELVRVGLPVADTIRPFLQRQHPDAGAAELDAALANALWRHGNERGPLRYQRADSGRWLELRMFPVPGGRIKLWTDVTHSGTEGTDASVLLELLTVTNLGVILHDARGQLRYANSRFFSQHFLPVLREVPDIRERHVQGDYWRRYSAMFEPSAAFRALCDSRLGGPLPGPVTLRGVTGRSYRIEEHALHGGIASLWTDVTDLADREQALARAHAELAGLNAQLQRMALSDPLTGLPNRRALELALAERHDVTAVALIDVDHFKAVNDRFGHEAGDTVMAEVASRLAGALAAQELLARLGGDEFAILLHSASEAETLARADALRRAVSARPVALGHDALVVTVSVGVAAGEASQEAPAEMLRRADMALLGAKAQGRDVVGSAPAPAPTPERAGIADAPATAAADPSLAADFGLEPAALAARHGTQHPVFTRARWAQAQREGLTLDHYWGWVHYNLGLSAAGD